ncbi:MAG: HPP family protein [Sedimentisphaerales bacterium]|nr:HPP family protein [Sedimentisphaerales bacterium]
MDKQPTIKEKFIKLWPYYIIQSALASITLGLILTVIGRENRVAISAMAATSFIVFAMPKGVSAQSRNVLGGHLTGLICGTVVLQLPAAYYIQYTLVVGLAIFFMVALDFEHPPAAGTSLAVVMNEVNFEVFLVILTTALALSLIHRVLGDKLRDLV